MQTEEKEQLIKYKITRCFIMPGARSLSVGANVVLHVIFEMLHSICFNIPFVNECQHKCHRKKRWIFSSISQYLKTKTDSISMYRLNNKT